MPTRSRAPRLPSDVRRAQLIAVALDVAHADGFDALTMDRVARQAGVTRPVVYDHFADRDELLAGVLDHVEQRALAQIGAALPDAVADKPTHTMLEEGTRAILEAVRDDPAVWCVVLLGPEAAPVAVRQRVARRRAQVASLVADIMRRAATRQGVLAGADFLLLARIVIASIEDFGRLLLEHPDRYPPARIGRTAGELGRLLAGGGTDGHAG